jgi:hypothetical protein
LKLSVFFKQNEQFTRNFILRKWIESIDYSRGLVVRAEDLWPRGPGFKPPLWRPFFRHHSFGSKLGTKFVENSNLALLHVL